MIISKKDKQEICRHYPHYNLKFMGDGTVMAKPKGTSDAWGILYVPRMTKNHIDQLNQFRQ